MKALAVIVAAGRGRRMSGNGSNKLLMQACGKPILAWTLSVFEQCAHIARVYVTASDDDMESYDALVKREGFDKVAALVRGGRERQESVYLALQHIAGFDEDATDDPLVAIHDGARPLLTQEKLEQVLRQAHTTGGAILGVPAKETLKRVQSDNRIVDTVPRDRVVVAQTPQVFRLHAILAAHAAADVAGVTVTDDAMLMEQADAFVHVVVGDYENIKVTTAEDLVALRSFSSNVVDRELDRDQMELLHYLEECINDYERFVRDIGSNEFSAPMLLYYRDEIQETLETLQQELKEEELQPFWLRVVELDTVLKSCAQQFVDEVGHANFKQYQIINDPPRDYWWWFLNRETRSPQPPPAFWQFWKKT